MNRHPLDFDISVSADKRRRMRRRGFSGAFESSQRACEWEGCSNKGDHRAPAAPDRLNQFRWFCSEHIRAYNKQWDFYSGMSPDEIETARRADQLWGRPTWRLQGRKASGVHAHPHAEGRAWERFGFKDPFEVLGENATINPGDALDRDERRKRRRLLPKADLKALEAMGLDETATRDSIRLRYKELVKQLHPDMNGGDRSEEERLRKVITAWGHLKKSAAFKA